jgi:hypothetical protein
VTRPPLHPLSSTPQRPFRRSWFSATPRTKRGFLSALAPYIPGTPQRKTACPQDRPLPSLLGTTSHQGNSAPQGSFNASACLLVLNARLSVTDLSKTSSILCTAPPLSNLYRLFHSHLPQLNITKPNILQNYPKPHHLTETKPESCSCATVGCFLLGVTAPLITPPQPSWIAAQTIRLCCWGTCTKKGIVTHPSAPPAFEVSSGGLSSKPLSSRSTQVHLPFDRLHITTPASITLNLPWPNNLTQNNLSPQNLMQPILNSSNSIQTNRYQSNLNSANTAHLEVLLSV